MKKFLIVILGLVLLSGCTKNEEYEKIRAELDSLKSAGKVKYEKIEKLSNADVSVYAVGADTSFVEGKLKVAGYGIEMTEPVAKLIGGRSFICVDGITVLQLKGILGGIDSLRKTNQQQIN